RRAASHSERIRNCPSTRKPCVHLPCQPDPRPLPTHIPGPRGTPDRAQGIAREWLEAVEVVRFSLSWIGGDLLAASEGPAVRFHHGVVPATWWPLEPDPASD